MCRCSHKSPSPPPAGAQARDPHKKSPKHRKNGFRKGQSSSIVWHLHLRRSPHRGHMPARCPSQDPRQRPTFHTPAQQQARGAYRAPGPRSSRSVSRARAHNSRRQKAKSSREWVSKGSKLHHRLAFSPAVKSPLGTHAFTMLFAESKVSAPGRVWGSAPPHSAALSFTSSILPQAPLPEPEHLT